MKIVNISNNENPSYATKQAAGMDLRAWLKEDLVIKPNEIYIVGTGLFIELPDGHEAQIRPRSGLAAKHGLTVINSPGTIDADYRGEIKIILMSLKDEITIKNGDRIAQMVINTYVKVNIELTENLSELNDTTRNTSGFGSTGIN